MGEYQVQKSMKPKVRSSSIRRMASPSREVGKHITRNKAPATGDAAIVRCPTAILHRLRHLNEAEWITLFTPVVPHPPSTSLAKNMDPFEPLGRALSRHVRHVPYRLDYGMTETHIDFLSSAGAVMAVVCAAENVVNNYPKAFDMQARFARDIAREVAGNRSLESVPVIVLLVANGADRQRHEDALKDMPALFTCNDYTESVLANAVSVIFGS